MQPNDTGCAGVVPLLAVPGLIIETVPGVWFCVYACMRAMCVCACLCALSLSRSPALIYIYTSS